MKCYYCALTGTAMHFADRNPCPECADWMQRGIILIAVKSDQPQGVGHFPVRAGKWAVVMDEAVNALPLPAWRRRAIFRDRSAFIAEHLWEPLGLSAVDMAKH